MNTRTRALALRLALLACGALAALPAPARASGAWSTWIHMVTTNDILALPDTLWMATGEAGLLRYLRATGQWESITREPGGLASNDITALAFDRTGRLWAGTAGMGVSRLSASGASWDLVNAFDGLPSDSVNVLRADGDTIWIGTTRGIALWNGTQITGSVPDLGTPSPFLHNDVTGIVVEGDSLLVSTANGLYLARLSESLANWNEIDGGIADKAIDALALWNHVPYALAGGVVYAPSGPGSWASTGVSGHADKLRDDFGTLLAVSPNGLFRWTGTGWNSIPAAWGSSSGADLTEIAADPAGKLFETHGHALLENVGNAWVTHRPPGPIDNDVQNVLFDGTRTWVDTFQGGVSVLDAGGWHSWTPGCCGTGQDTSFVDPSFAFTLQLDAAGNVWTSHWEKAIERIDPTTSPYTFDHVFVAAGLQTSDTLARHSDGWSSTVDPWGYVYVGGDTPDRGTLEPMGVDVYAPDGSRVINWKTTNAALRSNQVRALSVDKYHQIWAGFAQAGVAWANLDSVASVPGTANDHLRLPSFHAVLSLAASDIFGVVAHGDSVWVLTTSDLQRLRPTTWTVSASYDIPAGPAPRGAVHPLDVSPDGTVWVGSVDGVRRFPPGGGAVDYRVDNSPLADNEVRSVYVERATGAVWIATAAGLNRFDPHYRAPQPPPIPALHLRVWPNPASLTGLGARISLAANTATIHGEVLDLSGRVLRKFGDVASGGVVWDGRDADGDLVPPGVYFLRAHGAGRDATARVVVLR